MELLEKKYWRILTSYCDNWNDSKYATTKCAEIAEDYKDKECINFVEWITSNSFIQSSNNLWYEGSDGYPESGIETKELLELYKNELHK